MCVYKYIYIIFFRGVHIHPSYIWRAAKLSCWRHMHLKAWMRMPLRFTQSCTDLHSYKLSRPQEPYHDSQLFTLHGRNPSLLWSALKRMSNTAAIIFPSPAWAVRIGGRLPLPKPQGSTSSSHPGNSTEKSNTANCAMHFTYSPLTKSYRSEERRPRRKLQDMLSRSSWLFP